MNLESKAALINQYIQEWLMINNKTVTTPSEVEYYLAEKGIYKKTDNNRGKLLRSDLRELRKRNKLHLINGLEEVPKNNISNWFFYST